MPSFQISEKPILSCKDHTVSGEVFELRKDEDLEMLVTFPRPEIDKLPEYYKSENYISHTDSTASAFEKIYQGVKKIMLRKKIAWIEKATTGKGSMLDFGAGTGDFLVEAKNRGWEVSGVEPNEKARALAGKKKVTLKEDTSSFSAEPFDVITLWHVLEHVPDLEKQIQELDRLLKKDGLLIIAVPNFNSYDAKIYKEDWAAYDVPRHLFHFSRNSISRIFKEFRFEVVEEKALPFDAFYVSMLSEKNKGKNSNLLRGLFTGLLSNIKGRSTGEYSSIAYFLRKI